MISLDSIMERHVMSAQVPQWQSQHKYSSAKTGTSPATKSLRFCVAGTESGPIKLLKLAEGTSGLYVVRTYRLGTDLSQMKRQGEEF